MTQRPLKITFQFIIPLIISAGLCYILYSGMDWSDVEKGLRTCRWEWIGVWTVINILVMWVRAKRWKIQLKTIGVFPPDRVMLWSIFGTYAVNIVLPRLGEVWRCGYIAKRQKAPFTSVFGSMVADRLSDTISVLLITTITIIVASGPMTKFIAETGLDTKITAILSSPITIALLAAIATTLIIVTVKPKNPAIARLRTIIANIWKGFTSIFRMQKITLWLILTAGIWVGYFLSTWASFLAFDSTATLLSSQGAIAVLVTFVFGSWAMAIPSNGGIGPWQMAVMLSLSGIYGMNRGPALAFATIVLSIQTLLFIILGLYTFISILLDKQTQK